MNGIHHTPRFTFYTSRFAYPALILACFIALALAYGLVVPPFENLDEIEHFEVIRYIAEMGRLPAHGTPEAESYHYRQEASQPPLYHLLSAGLARLLGLETDDAAAAWRLNPWVACGPGAASLYDNRAVLYHNPNQEAFPWHSALLMLHVLRAWSTLLQVITVATTYALARLAFPNRRGVGLVAMAVVAFNPQFLLVASGVNNDNLLTPLVTVGLYLLLRTWRDGLSARRTIGLGILIGLVGLTKLSGWLLLPLSVAVIFVHAYRPPASTRYRTSDIGHWTLDIGHCSLFIAHCSLLIVHCSLLTAWWFWRNWQLYGDPTALQPMLELVGARGGSVLQSFLELGTMFRSFWGQLPCSFYPSGFYAFYAMLTTLTLSGLAWGWRQLARAERATTLILGSWFLLIIASWARWNAMTPAPGGRLLFPALPAVALLMALGISQCASLIRRLPLFTVHWSLVIGLLLMACWTAAQILPGFFAPPPRYADASNVHPAYPLDATLGDAVRLLGYDVTLGDQDLTLDVTLFWQSLAPIAEDYVMALQLASSVPGETTLRWNYNSWPGHGNYPTSAWQPGEVIEDTYRFQLPEADFPTQAWDLHLILYREETGERLPVRLDEVAAGDQLMLTRLRVPGHSPSCPDDGLLASEVRFGEATASPKQAVALTHAWVIPDQKETRVVLCWKALQPLPTDYTVFVHLLDASGALASTGDGPPVQGAFPTSMWRPGDVILDVHRLALAAEESGQRIVVGLYNLEDGSRLPLRIGDVSIPDAAVPVWPDRP